MAEHSSQPTSAWHSGNPSAHNPTSCPLEHVDLGISEQPTPLEQPPPSPDLGDEDEDDVDPPSDPDVPYPDLAPVVFFCLKQTTSPRNWCIKMVCNPYPLKKNQPHILLSSFFFLSLPFFVLLPLQNTWQVRDSVSYIFNESLCSLLAFKQWQGCCILWSKGAACQRENFRESSHRSE